MAENPYKPSVSDDGLESRDGLRRVAVSLLTVTILWASVLALCGMFMAYRWAGGHQIPLPGLVFLLLAFPYSLILVLGSIDMLRRGSYRWALTTSFLAIVPLLGPCYVVGIPVGIWALIVLRRPTVRCSFKSSTHGAG